MYYYGGQPAYQQQLQQTIPQQQQTIGLKGRPVSSLEEVRAAQIDFDGSLFVFPDIANRRIYTKQINLDGTASLNMYELAALPQTTSANQDYITRKEFDDAVAALKEAMASTQSAQPSQVQTTPIAANF